MEEGSIVRKLMQFIVCLCGLFFALLLPADPAYKGFLFMEATLIGAGFVFIFVVAYRVVEFLYWIKDED